MAVEEKIYDVVIIGSGMGGLSCANILAQEGKKVILLEKNRQIGGNLQVFSRDKCVFDTGVHYLGGLEKGQVLNKLFKYFGILDDLKLKKMDEDGFDHIHFLDEKVYYKYGMGYDNFIRILLQYFPEEREAIEKYCDSIKSIVKNLPISQLIFAEDYMPTIDFTLNAKEFINSLTNNTQLQKVLAGNNVLYVGTTKTPFYVHALVLHYYIESSWKCIDGSSQIASLMAKKIKELGGEILNRSQVISANYNNDKTVKSVNLSNGNIIMGKEFISNIHPQVTIDVFGKENFNKRFVDRIMSLKNSGGMFVVNIVFYENTFEYINHNLYQINTEDIWNLSNDKNAWPSFYMVSVPPNAKNPAFANGISVICGMSINEIEKWSNTFNNVTKQQTRGKEYEAFKIEKAEIVIEAISKHWPNIRSKIKSYTSSTPLSHRDYTASPNGSGYGIEKDSNEPYKTFINTKTSIPNLFLTGQNLILHGVLGVSLTALETCFNLVQKEALLEKINKQ